jgi:hypothetical protein
MAHKSFIFTMTCTVIFWLAANVQSAAQTDVTDNYLTNAGFDVSFNYAAGATGELNSGTLSEVSGWTHGSASNSLSATFQYGTAATFNGTRYSIPASGYDGASGGCIVINAGWGATLAYTQAVTLPAGRYALVYAVNNRNATAMSESRFGFVPASGTATYGTKTLFVQNSWLTDSVFFDISAETAGSISVGYLASGTYSYNNAALCVDFVKLLYYDALSALKMDFAAQKTLAQTNAARTGMCGFYNYAGLNAALTTANAINLTTVSQNDLQAAHDALKAANELAADIYTAYEPLKNAIAEANLYANTTNYPGRPAFLTAIATAQAVYNSTTDQRSNIASAVTALTNAKTTYAATRPSEWITIKNGALWKATNNNSAVQAHGAGFLQVGDKWYMVGEDRTSWNAGVNLYSSFDLQNWQFERKIIPPSAYSSSRFIERPKLLRCPSTGKFVVWCHYEGDNYASSEAASFVCDSVNGLYTFHWGGRPMGIKSRDCNVFQDTDGKAYFVSTTDENTNLTLFELSTDYLDVINSTRLTRFDGAAREAPAIVRIGNTYFLISSRCTGWDPNQATISYSTSLTSGWSAQTNIGNSITYDTQAASILTIQGTEKTTYLYVGDRWQDPALFESKTIMFPITFSGTTCTFNYKQQFDINFLTGQTRETPTTNTRVPKTGWSIFGKSSEETSSESSPASNAIDGNWNTKWHSKYSSPAGTAPHWIAVDMGATYTISGFLAIPRMDNSTNGLIREYIFSVSTDGATWQAVSGGTWLPYAGEVYFTPVQARYFKLTAISGTYASVAEFEILRNETHSVPAISPKYKISSGSTQTGNNVVASQAASVTFTPTSGSGTWAWALPNNKLATGREYTLSNLVLADSGVYSVCFLDYYSASASADFHLTVNKLVTSANRKLSYAITRAQAVYHANMSGAADLQNEISQATLIRNNTSYSIEQRDSITEVLLNHLKTYLTQNIALGANKTSLISTPKQFTTLTPAGWEGTMPTAVGSGCGEFYDTTFVFSQTVSGLENGFYLVGVQAAYRAGANDNSAGYQNANERQYATFFANTDELYVQSLYAHPYNSSSYAGTLAQVNSLFNINTYNFSNWILVEITDGTLTLGLKKATELSTDWCAFNNFQVLKMDITSAIDNIRVEKPADNRIFGIDGRYLGTGIPSEMNLPKGIYIWNKQKIVVSD